MPFVRPQKSRTTVARSLDALRRYKKSTLEADQSTCLCVCTFDRRWQLDAHGQGGDGGVLSNQVPRMG